MNYFEYDNTLFSIAFNENNEIEIGSKCKVGDYYFDSGMYSDDVLEQVRDKATKHFQDSAYTNLK